MPMEAIIASIIGVVFFGSFIAAMLWGLHYTRDVTPRW